MNIELRNNDGVLIARIERAKNIFQNISTSSNYIPGKPIEAMDKRGQIHYADTYTCVKDNDIELDSGLTQVKMYKNYYVKVIIGKK
jgi:hypothetical protein